MYAGHTRLRSRVLYDDLAVLKAALLPFGGCLPSAHQSATGPVRQIARRRPERKKAPARMGPCRGKFPRRLAGAASRRDRRGRAPIVVIDSDDAPSPRKRADIKSDLKQGKLARIQKLNAMRQLSLIYEGRIVDVFSSVPDFGCQPRVWHAI